MSGLSAALYDLRADRALGSQDHQKDGSREPFDHAKIKQGLEKACWKRPVSDEQLEAIVAGVENELEKGFDSDVESRLVGEMVMERLRDVDQVAYVRFASVYRRFKDVQDFVDDSPMLANSPPRTK